MMIYQLHCHQLQSHMVHPYSMKNLYNTTKSNCDFMVVCSYSYITKTITITITITITTICIATDNCCGET